METVVERLQKIVDKLSPVGVEILTVQAESLAASNSAPEFDPPRFDWVGGMSDQPEQSGPEAQAGAGVVVSPAKIL